MASHRTAKKGTGQAYAMPSEGSTTPSLVSPNPPIFQIHKPDTFDFASLPGLTKVTGEPSRRLRRLLLKELIDNALDAADAAGRPGAATIEKRDPDTYVITDQGHGLDGAPDALAALFAIHRPMVSTKYLRRPLRGALGNGLRVAVGCVVVSGGTIEVIARGKHVVLRPRRAGPTEIVSTSNVADTIGTTLIVTLDPTIPYDDLDTMWAEDAISLGRFANGPAYDRAPSAHWIDLDAFVEMLMLIEPDTVTVRQVVEMFDGCSGGKAGKLAAPFGKNRPARSMSDADAAALLHSMQAAARVVKPNAFGLIGPDAFDPDDYSYASAKGTFAYGAHEPWAEIGHVVEAWVCATTRKGKSVEIDDLFANRSPIVGGEVSAERDTYDPKQLEFSGCGLDSDTIDDFPLGDLRVSLHIVSPLIPLLSIGKRPNLEPFMPAIAEALRRAFKRSRDQLPLDMPEPKEKPPAKPPRPPKVEKPPKPPREVYVPQGKLGQIIAAQADASGLTVKDLRVMSVKRDPYTLDTEDNHRIGQWFGENIDRFVAVVVTIHLRGLHYILATKKIVRPDDGKVYENNHQCWNWLQDDASKAARWLGYVPFDRIHDARNEDPIWCAHTIGDETPSDDGERRIAIDDGSDAGAVSDIDELLPSLSVAGSNRPEQTYRLGLIGEKSSLLPVVEPIARQYSIDVVLDTGDASDSHLYQMALRASLDWRPFIVFYLSDFDPGGHHMPTSVARKFQALCDLRFPDLDLRLYPVALTLEQCIEYELPSAPLQPSEKRKEKWLARFGREQTELDALMALRPGVLDRLLHAAIEPFFDPTLDARFDAANALREDADAWFKALPAYAEAAESLRALHADARDAVDELAEAVEHHVEAVRAAVREAEDAPKLDPVEIKPDITVELPEPLFHSRDDFVTATRKLIARRDGGEGEIADATEVEDDEDDGP
jgi:hypothetical protein